MRQPKCRTCGKEHALGICPEFKKADEPKKSTAAMKESPNQKAGGQSALNATGAGTQVLTVDTHKPKVGRPSTDFDRNDYQRNYMADQRKASKLGMTVKEYRDGQKRD